MFIAPPPVEGTILPKLEVHAVDPTKPRLNARTALLAIFVALTIALASTIVYETGNRTTVTSTSTSTSTLTSISTRSSTVTSTSTLTSTVTTTSSVLTASGFQFITGSGICTAGGALALCWGEPAFVFNCPPSFPSGPDESCGQVVPNHGPLPYPPFSLSVTSYSNQSQPWANCAYQMGFGSKVGAYCLLLNSSAFIMGQPVPASTSTSSSAAASIQVLAASVSRLNPQTGLNLILNLTAKASPYPTITLTAYDVNTLASANNLTTSGDWVVPPIRVGACADSLVEYALYQGDYVLGNFTQATPLSQTEGIEVCTSFETSYCIFNPLSAEATIYWAPNGLELNPSQGDASVSASLLGFWGTNPTHPQGAYLVFPAGIYTVAAMDQWGNTVLSHFTVQG